MKITFVTSVGLGGGPRVVFEYSNQLQKLGHEITVVYPAVRDPVREWYGLKDILRQIKYRTLQKKELDWFDLEARLVKVPNLSEKFIPDSDVIVATWWRTAECINRYSLRKGKKFYLVQSYEIWGGPKDRVNATYKMPLKKIVISSWLKEIIEEKFKEKVYGPVINGVNSNQFYNENKVFHKSKRIGMMYSRFSLKGSGDGTMAFEMAREKYPDIKLVMYGLDWPGLEVPEDVEFHYNPRQDKLREIYSSCDIWLSPSWFEGCPCPPAEALACKCALVTTDVGGIRDYVIPGETALVSPIRKPEALARNLIRLLGDEVELKRLSFAGYERIKEFTWKKAAKQVEKIFSEG